MNNNNLSNRIIEKVQDKIAIFEFKKEDKNMKRNAKKLIIRKIYKEKRTFKYRWQRKKFDKW